MNWHPFPSAMRARPGTTCTVCSKQLNFAEALRRQELEYAVCASFDCRRIMGQDSQMNAEMFRHHLEFQRWLVTARRHTKKNHADTVNGRPREEGAAVLQTILGNHPALAQGAPHIADLPSGLSASAPSAGERRQAYAEHLQRIIRVASAPIDHGHRAPPQRRLKQVEARFAVNPELRTVSDRLCAICKGGYCIGGADFKDSAPLITPQRTSP